MKRNIRCFLITIYIVATMCVLSACSNVEKYQQEEQEDFLYFISNGGYHQIQVLSSQYSRYIQQTPLALKGIAGVMHIGIASPGYISMLQARKETEDTMIFYFDTAENAINAATEYNGSEYSEELTAVAIDKKVIVTTSPDLAKTKTLTAQSSFSDFDKKIKNDYFALMELPTMCECHFYPDYNLIGFVCLSLFDEDGKPLSEDVFKESEPSEKEICRVYYCKSNEETETRYSQLIKEGYSDEDITIKDNIVYYIRNCEQAKSVLGIG